MRAVFSGSTPEHDEGGFSLIELVVAMIVLAAMSVAVIGVILSAQAQSVSNRNRVAAANLAARELDLVREQFATSTGPIDLATAGTVTNPHQLAGGVAGQPLTIDGTRYTVQRAVQWNASGNGVSACDGGSIVAYPTLGVTVTVTWPKMGSVKPVVSTASLAPPKKVGIATDDSFLAVKVIDQESKPLAAMQLQATGGATAFTDTTGCAVIPVSPAAAGTAYDVTVVDPSYVDIANTVNPVKGTGTVMPGTIYSGVSFAVAKAGNVSVRLVRDDGVPLTAAQVAGSNITLVASQFSGASGNTQKVVTGVTTTFPGLWPTTYGAFFGTVPPAGGYAVKVLPAGGAVTVDAVFAMSTLDLAQLPAGTTAVWAYPSSAPVKDCVQTTGTKVPVSGSAATVTLLPGSYDFFAVGTTFACSPGPVAQALVGGDNDELVWLGSTLRLNSTTSGGSLWAVEQKLSGLTSPTTCPTSFAGSAVSVDAARGAAMSLPAGSWYVWKTDGAPTGTCLSWPDTINPLLVPYGANATKTWAATPLYATLTVTNIGSSRHLLVTTAGAVSCTTTTAASSPTGTPLLQAGPTGSFGGSLQVSALRPESGTTTYNAFIWRKSTGTCTSIGSFAVTPTTTSLSKVAP